MTNETYGIESLKAAVDVAISFPMQAAKTIKGKFKLIYVLAFIDEFRELAEVVSDREMIVNEFKDLSAEERRALVDHAKEKFDIPDDKVELFVENALSLGVSLVTLINEAKALRK